MADTLRTIRFGTGAPHLVVSDDIIVRGDRGCSFADVDGRFSRCTSCPLPAYFWAFSDAERRKAGAVLRRLGIAAPMAR